MANHGTAAFNYTANSITYTADTTTHTANIIRYTSNDNTQTEFAIGDVLQSTVKF